MENPSSKSETMFTITSEWPAQSKQLKEQFPQLTDSDLRFNKGEEQQLLSHLENKLNKKREEVIRIINKF